MTGCSSGVRTATPATRSKERLSGANSRALTKLDGQVFFSASSLATIRAEFDGLNCPMDPTAVERELTHLDFGVPDEQLRKLFAMPGFLVVAAESKAWLATFGLRGKRFDYAKPKNRRAGSLMGAHWGYPRRRHNNATLSGGRACAVELPGRAKWRRWESKTRAGAT